MSSIELTSYIIGFTVTFLVLIIVIFLCLSFFNSQKGEIISGILDTELIKDYNKHHSKRSKNLQMFSNVLSGFLTLFFIGCMGIGIYSKINNDLFALVNTTALVVKTSSMEKVNKANTYIYDNELTNQFGAYDLIFVSQTKEEKDIKLYDVVVFKYQNILIAHRVIEIVPDNNGGVIYITRGDANSKSDNIYLSNKDILGVYTNQKVAFVGYIIMFLQSPYSIIVLLVLLTYTFLVPIYENKLVKEGEKRLKYIGYIDNEGNVINLHDRDKFVHITLFNNKTIMAILDSKHKDISSDPFIRNDISILCGKTNIEAYQTLLDGDRFNLETNPFTDGESDEPIGQKCPKILKKSFLDKLRISNNEIKNRYVDIKTEALSYGLKPRISFNGETFRLHKKTYFKITISGKSLKIYFAIKSSDYLDSAIPLIDYSRKASKKETPSALWIKSNLAVKRAKQLIDEMCTKDGLSQKKH